MAKVIDNVRMFFTSANDGFVEDSMVVEYRLSDGDLSKHARWTASGLDFSQTTSGLWDEAVDAIKALEGVV